MQKKVPMTLFAYGYGWLFSLLSIALSYYFDLPTGYTIVFVGALSTLIGVLSLSQKRL
jgi:zinc/manganese transport system permease protein